MAADSAELAGGAVGSHPERGIRRMGSIRFPPESCGSSGGFSGGNIGESPIVRGFIRRSNFPKRRFPPGSRNDPAMMIIPTITAVTRDVLLAIPNSQREASMALGSTRG